MIDHKYYFDSCV